MWFDERGVSHSEALGEPTSVFDDESLIWMRTLSPRQIRAAIRRLKGYPDAVFERVSAVEWRLEGEEEYVRAYPPNDLQKVHLGGSMRLDRQVKSQIESIPLRWQTETLFAIMAVLWDMDDRFLSAPNRD